MIRRLYKLIQRLVPSGSTSQRVAKSLVWVLSQNAFDRMLPLVLLIILARLIGPLELGLVGIALLSMSALRSFTDVGLNEALIQRPETNIDRYLNTVLALEVARGLLIFVVLYFAAPLVTQLFDAPAAQPLIRVLAVSAVLKGLTNPAVIYFRKNLDFHKNFVYSTSGTLAYFFTGLGFALVSPSAWAWVAAFIASDIVRLGASYAVHSYRPGIGFDREAAADLIRFGKWITGSSLLFFLYNEGDDVIVGWLLSPVMLAYYQYAYRLSNAPATELSQVVAGVMFPAFSKYQTDTERLRASFLNTVRMVSLVAMPMGIGLAVVTPHFVKSVFGPEWIPMIPAMQALAIYGLFRAVGKTIGAVWKAIGRPDYITKLSVVKVILIAVTIYPVTLRYGITGVAVLITVINVLIMLPIDLYIISRNVETTVGRVVVEIAYPLAAALVMGGAAWYVGYALSLPALAELVLMTLTGAIVYAGVVLALDTRTEWGIRRNVRELLSNVLG